MIFAPAPSAQARYGSSFTSRLRCLPSGDGIHHFHPVVIPRQQIMRCVFEFISPLRNQRAHLLQNFQRGKNSDSPFGHGQQAIVRFAAPAGAGKDDVGVKNDAHVSSPPGCDAGLSQSRPFPPPKGRPGARLSWLSPDTPRPR